MKRMIILVSLLFTIFITGCSQQNEKVSDTEKPSIHTDKTTTQADKPSSKSVIVTVHVKDKLGNLIPNVAYQWDGMEIANPLDKDGILKQEFPSNTEHTVMVWKESKEVSKSFEVPDSPITLEVIIP